VEIPGYVHGALIAGGQGVKAFEDAHQVRVTFEKDPDGALVEGSPNRVEEASKELRKVCGMLDGQSGLTQAYHR
jgi:hypothetical protein